jgi:hypothetical protein
VGGCSTREEGGCYCVCRLKGSESTLLFILEGKAYVGDGGGIIYETNRDPIPLIGDEKEKTLQELKEVREKLKSYEITE